jgi:SAM-dependent methyltransferase
MIQQTPCPWDQIAGLYDDVFARGDDLEFWARTAGRYLGATDAIARRRLLELGSGTGRVTAFLAARGFAVDAVESSPGMIEQLRTKLWGELQHRVNIVRADMLALSLRSRYGLVVCPFNTYATLVEPKDRARLLRSARRHLTREGVFAFDVIHRDLRGIQGSGTERVLLGYEAGQRYYPYLGVRMQWSKYATVDARSSVQTTEVTAISGEGPGRHCVVAGYPMKVLDFRLVKREVESSDLRVVEVFGDYNGSRFDHERSKVAVFVCRAA